MQNSCVEECKGRAAFAFCLTLTGMQLRSKCYARPAIHRSTKRPFPHFTSGVRNQSANGVSWYRSRSNHSAAGKTTRKSQKPNPKLQTNSINNFFELKVGVSLKFRALSLELRADGALSVENDGRR